jgi:chemotaxis protein CheD
MIATAMTSDPQPRSQACPARVYLHPGQLFASAEPAAVTTVLGSCVAVCLWDSATGVGGINHFQLPQWSGKGARTPRYASVAIQALLERLLALGARRGQIEAKVFGGACVTANVSERKKSLGDQNVEHALVYLRECAIPVSATATGGRRGRKLVFHTNDGTAWVREL